MRLSFSNIHSFNYLHFIILCYHKVLNISTSVSLLAYSQSKIFKEFVNYWSLKGSKGS
ncbi:hypothetical protein RhiirB3_456678 [Rhizophagus irregularis]|nr:hypothetical protein RhiirB3_456678 [Rhizophagus irregularis]